MSLRTLNDIFIAVYQRRRDRVMLQREALGWIPISSAEVYRSVVGLARALESWGIRKGDRVAILSENRPEWTITDFAALALGAVTVPIYATQTAEQTSYILNDAGARVIAVSTKKSTGKGADHPAADAVRAHHGDGCRRNCACHPHADSHAARPDRLRSAFDARARSVAPDDLATIIYTSGTTGTPKGAMLTHGNMASNISRSLRGFGVGDKRMRSASRFCRFPMSPRGTSISRCSTAAWCWPIAPTSRNLAQALTEVQPNIFIAVPRVYEKIRQQVILKARAFPRTHLPLGAFRSAALTAPRLWKESNPPLSWKIANRLVFSKVRAGMGGKAEEFISGGAPLGRELAEWYADIGIPIHEGIRADRNFAGDCREHARAHKLGTVGKPLAKCRSAHCR
jgi:long-chain acyl-CoA synthetase